MKHSPFAPGSFTTAVVAAVAVATCALPAMAQPAGLPSYASREESIRGRVESFDGQYHLQLRDDRGFLDNVNLHPGTVINPTGLRLSAGQSITILGHNTGKTFEANQIDTPYTSYGGPPAYTDGYGYGYGPYGYYPYRYGYGAYPAFGLGFRTRGFGFRGWY